MKLITIIFVILQYVGTFITGIIAILGAKTDTSGTVAVVPTGTKPPPKWRKVVLILAILSLMVAIASQVAEQVINARDRSELTGKLDSTSNQQIL